MSREGEQGFALLIVLWSLVLLTLVATGVAAAGRSDVQLAANLRAAAQAEAAADAGISNAAFHVLDPVAPWPADGRQREIDLPGARVMLQIENEAGKVNPNTTSPELLQALLRGVGAGDEAAQVLAVAIATWRFPYAPAASAGLGLPGPASAIPQAAQPYRAAGLGYGPPGAPFESVDELGLVLGMTPELLARLRPHVSIWNDADPDPRLADPVVLQALGQALGPRPPPDGPPAPPRTITVVATARTPYGSRFVRRATVRLGRSDKEPLMQVLTWSVANG